MFKQARSTFLSSTILHSVKYLLHFLIHILGLNLGKSNLGNSIEIMIMIPWRRRPLPWTCFCFLQSLIHFRKCLHYHLHRFLKLSNLSLLGFWVCLKLQLLFHGRLCVLQVPEWLEDERKLNLGEFALITKKKTWPRSRER